MRLLLEALRLCAAAHGLRHLADLIGAAARPSTLESRLRRPRHGRGLAPSDREPGGVPSTTWLPRRSRVRDGLDAFAPGAGRPARGNGARGARDTAKRPPGAHAWRHLDLSVLSP